MSLLLHLCLGPEGVGQSESPLGTLTLLKTCHVTKCQDMSYHLPSAQIQLSSECIGCRLT